MRRRIWGWYFFDWASQPFSTLLMTFIFAPYIARILGDGAMAQTVWGYGLAVTGAIIAVASPLLGAVADRAGGHMRFLVVFSVMYVAGSWGLWWAAPDDPRLIWTLVCFGIGMIGMELATVFTNALLPTLAGREAMGRISGSGWAFGYLGGLISLMLMLVVFQTANPPFGLDPAAEEGTRIVGPLTAVWYLMFMIPFFAFVRGDSAAQGPIGPALRQAWPDLRASLSHLRQQRSLMAFLASSMLYRDALNGIYAFGGIYAVGVLGWEVREVGIFGILAALSGAVFAWIGGRADGRFGPRPVIATCLIALILAAAAVVAIGPGTVFGVATDLGTPLFFALGAVIGAAGGAVQAASRTMVLDQADPSRMTEAFGLFALSGKATAFLAPLLIGIATQISGSQRIGIVPVIALFLGGLILLCWVKPHRAAR